MPDTPLSEDPYEFIRRVLSHAKKHIELSEQALENKELETLEFTLRVAMQDITTILQYIVSLKESGILRGVKLG